MGGIDLRQIRAKGGREVPQDAGWSITKLLETNIELIPTRFTDKNREAFYLELSTLLTAGLDIKSCLELMEGEQVKPRHAQMIAKIKDDLIAGAALWEALKASEQFTPYEYYSVQIGEETGKVNMVLEQLYNFYNAKLKQRRQFVSALSYPIIILFTSFGAVTFMLLFIVPMFRDVFKRFGGELPYLTKIIMRFSTLIQSNFGWFLALLISVSAIIYYNRDKIWMRRYSSKFVARIPIIGNIIYAVQLARFCSSMSLLLGSKVPLMRSINLIAQMVTFYPIQITLDRMAQDVMNGSSLHHTMSQFDIYSRRMISLVKVGEEVNRLDVFFEKLSRQFSGDVEHQTSLLNTFLEPAMIIFLGLVVGFILLAMYLPMFEISTSIGG